MGAEPTNEFLKQFFHIRPHSEQINLCLKILSNNKVQVNAGMSYGLPKTI